VLQPEQFLAQVRETWRTNHRVTLLLLAHISDEGLRCTLSKRGGRTVARQLAHLHSVRVWHLESRAADLAKGMTAFATEDEPDRGTLEQALTLSAARVESFLERAITGEGKARAAKKGAIASLGYFIAHDSHHRGNILLTLKQCGHRVDPEVAMSIWDWDNI
jgi:uncharacterized damage-inducible protein DinB